MMRKVALLMCLAPCALCLAISPALAYDPVVPGYEIQFPRDAGAHPGHRIEWWYVTGHLDAADGGAPMGFQVTFFRVRNPAAEGSASRFAPAQLLFAHAALADPAQGHLLHEQRSARGIAGLVEAAQGNTDVRIDDWSLRREDGVYRTRITGDEMALDLAFTPTQAPLLQGDRGFSRKGPDASHASYYYSEPQLRVSGRVVSRGRTREVSGIAWLDHEWSSQLLAGDAAGWDWLGADMDDGAALMAFRIRANDGTTLWSSATWRGRDATALTFDRGAVAFTPRRTWRSARSGTTYPVEMEVRVGERTWRLEPLMDDQEMDARTSTGTLYWEGAVRLEGSDGSRGRGYLELTGYAGRLPF
jgi:predicted secreted hydrolase